MDLRTMLLLLIVGLSKAQSGYDHDSDNEVSVDNSDLEDFTTTILRMNNGSRDFLLEGDILIPKTRNARKCFYDKYSCLWSKSADGNVRIPYLISDKYDSTERNEILAALKDFAYKTCIRFVPRFSQKEYLSIEPRFGCASIMGRSGGKQVLSLQRFGCIRRGIIQHELLHALGFYHEHSRSDRDQYVKINWDNIKKYMAYNFDKHDSDTLNTPYDYSSVMHYGRNAFGNTPQLETITPIPDASVSIGQREEMSKIDIHRVNKLYRCWSYIE